MRVLSSGAGSTTARKNVWRKEREIERGREREREGERGETWGKGQLGRWQVLLARNVIKCKHWRSESNCKGNRRWVKGMGAKRRKIRNWNWKKEKHKTAWQVYANVWIACPPPPPASPVRQRNTKTGHVKFSLCAALGSKGENKNWKLMREFLFCGPSRCENFPHMLRQGGRRMRLAKCRYY